MPETAGGILSLAAQRSGALSTVGPRDVFLRQIEGSVGGHGVSARDASSDIVEFESGVVGQHRFRIVTLGKEVPAA
jgi:hypothetical protein